MNVPGISPSTNEPFAPGLQISGLLSDVASDQEMMLALIRQLPNVIVSDDPRIESEAIFTDAIELDIQWELDPDSPLLDFVSQLLNLLRRTTITQGVALDKNLAGRLDRIARHCSCVAEAVTSVCLGNHTNTVP